MMVSDVGPDHQRLFELFAAADGDHGELGREARDVRLLLLDEAARNQQRKSRVDVAGGLEAAIERLLDVFPERPAVGPHDHAAAHRSVVSQLGAQNELVVPLGEVFGARRQLLIGHGSLSGADCAPMKPLMRVHFRG